MATITLKGNPIHTIGALPKIGAKAPDFKLTKTDLSDVTLKNFSGKKIVLNIFPSIDTPVCAISVRKFNETVSQLKNTVVLCVAKDLPFALKRFCGAEGIEKVIPASSLRNDNFGNDYGVKITDGPLAGLFARAIVVINEEEKVVYTEQVPEIAQEPDYEAVVHSLK